MRPESEFLHIHRDGNEETLASRIGMRVLVHVFVRVCVDERVSNDGRAVRMRDCMNVL